LRKTKQHDYDNKKDRRSGNKDVQEETHVYARVCIEGSKLHGRQENDV
jgi:hypothetical protein